MWRCSVPLVALLLAGCTMMHDQARIDRMEVPERFGPVAGTVPWESEPDPGRVEYTRATLDEGRLRYEIHCSPCHGLAGDGDGMVVRRGFPAPPSLHEARLREAPDVHFWSVMTNGAGRMDPYADRLTSAERWAVVAWVRVLQSSRRVPATALPPGELP